MYIMFNSWENVQAHVFYRATSVRDWLNKVVLNKWNIYIYIVKASETRNGNLGTGVGFLLNCTSLY